MYPPDEDSFLLEECVKKFLKNKNKKLKILDMGCGSCIQAICCRNSGFINIVCCDIEEESVKNAENLGFKAIKSNLFSNIKEKFDLIIFNPPYLPKNKYDKNLDTVGGKFGDETILKFLKQAKNHLTKKGKILLLISSLTIRDRINKIINKYKRKRLMEKNLFFEKLEVWLLSQT